MVSAVAPNTHSFNKNLHTVCWDLHTVVTLKNCAMALQFYLSSRPLKSGEKPITMSAHIANTRIQTTIGISVNPDYWLDAKQKVKKGAVNAKGLKFNEINDKLDAIAKAFSTFETKNNGAPTNKQVLKDLLHDALYGDTGKPKKEQHDFYETFDKIVATARVERQWSDSTIKKHNTFRKHLVSFAAKTRFADWNSDKLSEFVAYEGAELDMKDVSIQKDLKMLKWFLRRAMEIGVKVPADFITFKPKFKLIDKEVVFLTWDELLRLYNFDVPKDGTEVRLKDINGKIYKKVVQNRSSLIKTRDLFCFCAFTGLRYSDMASLKRTDITEDGINVITEKTDCALKVPFNAYSRTILQKYEDENYPGNLALPVISNQKMNEYLKDICELCGFTTPVKYSYYKDNARYDEVHPKWAVLGTHGGRRTFICAALEMGIPTTVIRKITGHANEAAMRPYIAITDKTKADAMSKFSDRKTV